MCGIVRQTSAGIFQAAIVARWPGMAGYSVASNRCRFNCQGGVCVVGGGDALPVELPDFSIDEYSDPDTEGNPESDEGTPDAESSP